MQHTNFLGFTQLEPGDGLFDDEGRFAFRNLTVLATVLQALATHHHDGHAALTTPTAAPVTTFDAVGGALPADSTFYAGFTAVDAQGGETLLSPVTTDATPGGLGDVPEPPTAVVDYTAGTLLANTFEYVLTAVDDTGGESEASDPVIVTVAPGQPNARIVLDTLMTQAAAVGGTSWRLYRATNGGQLGLLGTGATEGFTDDGAPCLDPQLQPPVANTSTGTGVAHIVVAAAAVPAGAVAVRAYASPDPAFPSPSYVGEQAFVAGVDLTFDVASFGLQSGGPPPAATSLAGPPKISAVNEIDWTGWTGGGGGGGGLTVDGNAITGIELVGGIGEDFASAPGDVQLWVGWRNLSSTDFSTAGVLADPNYIEQDVALDAGPFPLAGVAPDVWGALEATAAGDDARIAVLTGGAAASINSDSPQRSDARFFAAVADDKFGTTVKQLDIDNFIEGRVNNATGAPVIELVVVDAGVETILASAPLPAAVTSSCWLRTELNMGAAYNQTSVVGCSVYLVPPTLELAESYGHVAAILDAAQNTKFGIGVVAGYGLRLQPAAGGNTLRATEWNGWRQ